MAPVSQVLLVPGVCRREHETRLRAFHALRKVGQGELMNQRLAAGAGPMTFK
jgi:hypothetical protein